MCVFFLREVQNVSSAGKFHLFSPNGFIQASQLGSYLPRDSLSGTQSVKFQYLFYLIFWISFWMFSSLFPLIVAKAEQTGQDHVVVLQN